MRRWRSVILTSLLLLALAAAIPLGLHVHDVGAFNPPAPALGDRYAERAAPDRFVTLDMLFIPGGTFTMGSPDAEPGRQPDEGLTHTVRVEPFWMSRTEVTADWVVLWLNETGQAQFPNPNGRALTPAAKRAAAAAPAIKPYGPPFDGDNARLYPATTLTAYGAQQFCVWLTARTGRLYRLPTEAEWEYACRAGTTTAWHFGNDPSKLKEYAWVDPDDAITHPVAQKRPNPWGLYDMYGNASEFVCDGPSDYRSRGGGSSGGGAPIVDPWAKPADAGRALTRGGNVTSDPADTRSARRQIVRQTREANNEGPMFDYADSKRAGFRVVSPLRRTDDGRDRAIPPPPSYW